LPQDIEDEAVLKLEFDNRWEGPGDAFQAIIESNGGTRGSRMDSSPRW